MNSKIKILIADDDTDDKEMLIESMKSCISNFEVETATDGAECLRMLKHGSKPDIVFLDLNMPLRNGLECLREIQNDGSLSDTPVIIYSTSHNLKDIKAASGYGARFYLVKPTSESNLKQLLRFIFKLLGLPRQEQVKKDNFVIAEEKLGRILNYHIAF